MFIPGQSGLIWKTQVGELDANQNVKEIEAMSDEEAETESDIPHSPSSGSLNNSLDSKDSSEDLDDFRESF